MKNLSGTISTLIPAVLALLIAIAVPVQATVIFSDDYDIDQNPVTTADIGTYDVSSSAPATSGFLQTFGSGVKAAGTAIQTSTAGTELLFEWDWNLLGNDNVGATYNPIAGLAYNADDRVLGFRVIYVGADPEPTTGNLYWEQAGGGFVDSTIDVPVGTGFQDWSVEYTVGAATAILNIAGVAAVTDQSVPVAFPAEDVVGPWFLGSGSTNSRFDNVTLTIIPEPATLTLVGLGALLVLRRKRA